MTQASESYAMNREPLTKAQVKCGEPANAPCPECGGKWLTQLDTKGE